MAERAGGGSKRTASKSAASSRTKKRGAGKPSLAVRKACFLEVLRQTANISRAAREAGLSTSTVYTHKARHAAFARDWDAAVAEALDALESELIERARNGVEKPVYYRGEVVGSVRTYSDALGMFMLKAKRPEVYDRMTRVTEAPVTITQTDARAEVVRRLEALVPDEDDGA